MTARRDSASHGFAKASMIDLVVRYLKRTRPELVPNDAGTIDAVRQATVPAAFKNDLLGVVWRQAGAEALLSIGQGIGEVGYDPLWHAAVRSANPATLFDKWRRFEVFGHSRNRLRIDLTDEKRASFHRYTVDGGTPTAPENLFICGLIIALLEAIGCLGLRCRMPREDGKTDTIRERGRFSVPDDASKLITAAWTIDWRTFVPRLAEAASKFVLPEIPLSRSSDSTPGSPPGSAIKTVLRLLTYDVSRHWKISDLAREAGYSTRSLQRILGDAELSYSHLVRLVRIHEACRLLKESDAPITTVGFCAGFSDSAHFSRDFRASTGMTPSDYRAHR